MPDDQKIQPSARYRSMAEGTKEDYELVFDHLKAFERSLADRVLAALKQLKNSYPGELVNRLTHSLQTATRAQRDGRDEEYVVAALLHDIGDTLASANHSELAATILQPFVSEENYWIVKHHGVFQGYYFFHHFGLDRNAREAFRGHPLFGECAAFCALYDQNCFDPGYDTLPLAHFEPSVRKVFAVPKQ